MGIYIHTHLAMCDFSTKRPFLYAQQRSVCLVQNESWRQQSLADISSDDRLYSELDKWCFPDDRWCHDCWKIFPWMNDSDPRQYAKHRAAFGVPRSCCGECSCGLKSLTPGIDGWNTKHNQIWGSLGSLILSHSYWVFSSSSLFGHSIPLKNQQPTGVLSAFGFQFAFNLPKTWHQKWMFTASFEVGSEAKVSANTSTGHTSCGICKEPSRLCKAAASVIALASTGQDIQRYGTVVWLDLLHGIPTDVTTFCHQKCSPRPVNWKTSALQK